MGQQSHQPSRTSWPRYHQSLIREAGILLMQEGKYLLGNAPKILSCSEPTFYPQLHSPIMWESWTLKGFHRISLVQFSCMRNKNKAWRLIFELCSKLEFHAKLCSCSLLPPNSKNAAWWLQWKGRKTLLGTDTMFLGILRYCSEQCCINHIHCSAIGTMLQSRKVHKPCNFYADIFYPVLHKIIKKS